MTEQTEPLTILLAGRIIGIVRPTQGQFEAMARISRTIATGTDDEDMAFWTKQVARVGTLIEALIIEGDRDLVDELFLTGKVTQNDLLRAMFDKYREGQPVDKPAKKVAKTRVQRA